MALSGSQITRIGTIGFPGRAYAGFVAKSPDLVFVEGARSWTIKARSVILDTLTRGIGWDTEDRPITWTTPERDDT